MQYLLLIYEAEDLWEAKSDEEKNAILARHGVLNENLDRNNVAWSGNPLMPTSTAVSLRNRGGELQVSDGPFAETKEQLAGYYLIDVDSLEAAMDYAAQIPAVDMGTIEVRPIASHPIP